MSTDKRGESDHDVTAATPTIPIHPIGMMCERCSVRLQTTLGTRFWRWRVRTTTFTCLCRPTRSTVLPILLGNSSHIRGSTCWSGIRGFKNRISGVVGSGRSGTTWEQQGRGRRRWLNGISRRRNTRSVSGFITRSLRLLVSNQNAEHSGDIAKTFGFG